MKKVFAFLSTLVLTIALVGVFAVNNPAKAADKFTEDPTLLDDEIAVYIMDSIMTTFPNYYDNDAKEDPNWQGTARMYPWNETRLRVAQLDESGQPTGKYYAVYFSGHTTAVDTNGEPIIGAGKNILFYQKNEAGQVIATKFSDGKQAANGAASDPSLSHMRTNITGEDIEFDPTQLGLGDEGTNYYNRSIVFNAQGQVIRGIGLDDQYTSGEGDYKFAPEYCYVDGAVTKIEDGVVCDKVMEDLVDEEGNPVMDENGETIQVPTDEDRMFYSRFVWEFFEEAPENVNEVGYLADGWDPNLWDYCYERDGGYICIAFVGNADNSAHIIKGDQITAYIKTLMAQGKDEAEATQIANSTTRACTRTYRVPAGGFVYDFGFLDRGLATTNEFFKSTVLNGYLYGRTQLAKKDANGEEVKDEEGNSVMIGIAEQRTYNFSVTGLTFDDKVIDGASYQLLAGQNVVEVMQGNVFNPVKNINYNGIMRYWGVQDDLTSYTASSEALEFYIDTITNGGSSLSQVAPSTGYTSIEDIKNDFLAAVAKHRGVEVSEVPFDTAANWQGFWSWGSFMATSEANATNSDGTPNDKYPSEEAPAFFNVKENRDTWGWLIDRIYQTMLAYPGGDTYTGTLANIEKAAKSFYCPSPQGIAYGIWYFLNGQSHTYFGFNFGDGNNESWIDPRTNLEKWEQYTLDATMKAPNENWVVTFKVLNTSTNISSSLTIKYVVVDSYTPIINVNKDNLFYIPNKQGDAVVCNPIDQYTLVNAYDAQYNGVNILGNDVTQYVDFDTDLDFANPKEGTYPVTATIWNNAHTKKASVKFNVTVRDITAPNVTTRRVVIQQGDDFDCRDGIVLAVDNVDRVLKNATFTWWEEVSNPVDTVNLNPGEDMQLTIRVNVYDKSNNVRSVDYTLVIVADKYVEENLTTAFNDLNNQLTSLKNIVNDIYDTQETQDRLIKALQAQINELFELVENNNVTNNKNIDELKDVVADISEKVEGVQTTLDENAKGGCKNSAVLVLEIAGAATLLALVLRKRH